MTGKAIANLQEDDPDDRPIAVRRKRRGSPAVADRENRTNHTAEQSNPDIVASLEPRTPTKPKKRVRFSDPGREPAASSSTGLTPYLRRTGLKTPSSIPTLRLLAEKPRKRRSLPSDLSTSLPSPSLSPPLTPFISGEMQFAPLRQVLDERLKRRLRRNNMSEEINEMDAEKRSCTHWKQEAQELRDELAVVKQLGQEVNDSVEGEGDDSERIRGLVEELATLRQKMQEKSTTADENQDCANISSTPGSTPESSTSSDALVDDGFPMNDAMRVGDSLEAATQVSLSSPPFTTAEAAAQVSLPSPSLTTAFRSARLSLEHLFPGEITLGLDIEELEPLLKVTIELVEDLRVQKMVAESALSTSKTQEANLRNSFNAVLQQLKRSQSFAEDMTAQLANNKARADQGEQKIQQLEIGYEQALASVREMETDIEEKESTIRKLQDALETYRVEVRTLETLVNRLEGEHNQAMSSLKGEMDEAVADLECHVAAETTGRRAAEKEAVERRDRIKQLEQLEKELKGAMSEKQQTIRDLEKEIADVKEETEKAIADVKEGMEKAIADVNEGREKEVGVMNVNIGNMTSSLEEANSKLVRMEAEKAILLASLEEEKAAARKAVEEMQSAMEKSLETVEEVKESYVKDMQIRGAEVAEHRGLLTPVSVCKFKDIEGYVEVKRGKVNGRRRPDSGIGVLEEDEFEDLMEEDT
ncbi:hypothetical protein MMC29_003424 [Sticta canariensis]|nr:hypothetical protein [Sticta canariensis]